MAYEPDGLRIKLEDSTGTRKFIWDDQNYLAETDENNDTQVVYTNEPAHYGNLISQRRGSTTNWYHFDAIGSTRELTLVSEAISDTYLYDASGNVVAETGATINPFQFLGEVAYRCDPDTGWLIFGQQYYDVSSGHWLSHSTFPSSQATLPQYTNAVTKPGFLTATGGVRAPATPSGRQPAAPGCRVALECVKLVGIGGVGVAEHCGLEVTTPRGSKLYHVHTGTCDPKDSRPRIPYISGSYFTRGAIITSEEVCACIEENADRMRLAKLPYSPIPGNDDCGSDPTCNSNYTTKCLLQHCAASSLEDQFTVPPVGWGHRMKKCTNSIIVPLKACPGGTPCVCLKWETVDDKWCSKRTLKEVEENPGR